MLLVPVDVPPRGRRLSLLRPAPDASAADWLAPRLGPFATSVAAVVPGGFARYARLFHPAARGAEPVRWATVAAANGKVAHALMQWHAVAGEEPQPGLWDAPPAVGTVPRPVLDALLAVLSTEQPCWFAVWEGFGGSHPWVHRAPAFELPGRRYHLFTGPLEAARESFCEPPWWQPANLWWPDDRSWCVATEIDYAWTFVGGSHAVVAAVLGTPAVEAFEVRPTDEVTWWADTVNG